MLRAVLSETHRRPALMVALHESIFDPRAAELRTMLSAAAAAGEIRADVADSPVPPSARNLWCSGS
ncbi:TetR/AcrR family transcriptional regulator C-terminal ligand-binding domain-containing protein [Nocardia mangyaensis]|uniref:TetR/AcrR family transcriptional regulator C-terminal ligand-binding domain-containing protein n=1 Tax=Nocardia mangyaensis TaxID=2213200 RepID=UPI003B837086